MIVTPTKLEEQSLWYAYKSLVWHVQGPQSATVHNIMRVLRAVRNQGELAYASAPITSGRFLYDLSLAQPSMSADDKLNMAVEQNYLAGWEFVQDLMSWLDCPVLYPADLVPIHQQWEQKHFQALWLSIIAEKCTHLYMGEDWEYSNGGCEEFTHTMQLRLGIPRPSGQLIFYNTKEDEASERARMRSIQVFDRLGNPLSIDDGIGLIRQSWSWITASGFDAPKVRHCLDLLESTRDLIREGFYQ